MKARRAVLSASTKETTMVRSCYLLIALLAVSSAASAQNNNQFRPHNSPEDRACRSDAHRFCRDAIPDDMRVASCLQEHREHLSKACRAMLESHGL
jgi:hypothetical protein